MMFRSYTPFRSGLKTAVLLSILALLTLTCCAKETEPGDSNMNYDKTYSNIELHLDAKRSKKLGVPFPTHYNSSGEIFTGVKKVYYTVNDSFHSKLYYKKGILTKEILYKKDGDTITLGIYCL